MISTFLIGPQFPQGNQTVTYVDVFAPHVYLRTKDNKLTKFQMFVFLGFKTMFVMLLKPETQLSLQKLKQLQVYLNR